MATTHRLYWQTEAPLEALARVVAVRRNEAGAGPGAVAVALDQTPVFPGGGGQPADVAGLRLPSGRRVPITESVAGNRDGAAGRIDHKVEVDQLLWHTLALPDAPEGWAELAALAEGSRVQVEVAAGRRAALSRHHTALHIVNTVAMQEYGAWITGAQIGEEQSRIDFKIEGFSPALLADLEARTNAVITANHPTQAFFLPEEEFARRPELLRTLEVRPPVYDGRVRVVAIAGFDEQACGGTHAAWTRELGRLQITKTENKGRINKRLYVRLEA